MSMTKSDFDYLIRYYGNKTTTVNITGTSSADGAKIPCALTIYALRKTDTEIYADTGRPATTHFSSINDRYEAFVGFIFSLSFSQSSGDIGRRYRNKRVSSFNVPSGGGISATSKYYTTADEDVSYRDTPFLVSDIESYISSGDRHIDFSFYADTSSVFNKNTKTAITRCTDVFTSSNPTNNSWTSPGVYLHDVEFDVTFLMDNQSYETLTFDSYFLNQNQIVDNMTLYYEIPPTFNASQISCSPSTPYKSVSSASTIVSNATAYCGGYISNARLSIGSQSATGSGNGVLTIPVLNTTGTYSPYVQITDSRGRTNGIYLNNITVKNVDIPPTFNATDLSFVPISTISHDKIYKDFTKASSTISNISVAFNGTVTATRLKIGNQTAVGSGNGTLTINPLNAAGKFTPYVEVEDSWGLTTIKPLTEFTVKQYDLPQVDQANYILERCNPSTGLPEDEGTAANITVKFNYTSDIAYLTEPVVKIKNSLDSGDPSIINVTWYRNKTVTQNGVILSDPVDWTDFNPGDGVFLYARYSLPFIYSENYVVYIIPTDLDYKEVAHSGIAYSNVLPTAYYTMDFLADGHGVAFGRFARLDDTLDCDMTALFRNDILLDIDYDDANDPLAVAIKKLGWKNQVEV